jgi:flagellin
VTRPAVIATLFAGALTLAAEARGSSITNGGFETTGFTGWTVDHATSGSLLSLGGHAHSGAGAAWFGAIGAGDDALSQTFATLPGESYVVTFWLAHGASDSANDFTASWNSAPLLSLINASSFGQREYTFTATAAGDESTLRFSGRELVDYYFLDDVSVVPVPTPEPATLALVAAGAAILARRARARRHTKPA